METVEKVGFIFKVEVSYNVLINSDGFVARAEESGIVISEYSDGRDIAQILSDYQTITTHNLQYVIKTDGLAEIEQRFIKDLTLLSAQFIGPASGKKELT